VVVVDNHGFSSIGGLSQATGSNAFGTKYRFRSNGDLDGDVSPIDFVANAASMGAKATRATTIEEFEAKLEAMKGDEGVSVLVVETDLESRVDGYESWWEVPIAEVSTSEAVQAIRKQYEEDVKKERYYL